MAVISCIVIDFLLVLLLICLCDNKSNDREAKNVTRQRTTEEIKNLKREVEKLKSFVPITVEDVEVGQRVSNANGSYICINDVIVNGKKKFFDWFDEKIVYIGIKNEVRIRDDLGSEIDDYAWKKYAWSVDRYFDKQKTETEMTQAEIEDSFFINAKRYFLQYAKRQSEPIFDVAKRELEHIENSTHSVCEDDDLKKFRTVSKRIQTGVLIEIMGENGGE
ncbi:hypothetical protein [Lachnospira multipara]|uniref:Uncharacterized protein n=1 Tax=Lachnospira multipara TaxID=28051 RepID=A0A1H5VUF7_9FIRM|nr:hypothetical protein [Lachnospira multipara]SEF90912.1 hypothetical protein SAMN05216537_112107 [Lachnospira multipara]